MPNTANSGRALRLVACVTLFARAGAIGCTCRAVPARTSSYVPRFWCAAFAHFDVRSPASLVEQLNVAVGCQVADFSGDLSVHTVRGPRLVACFVLGRSVLRAAT